MASVSYAMHTFAMQCKAPIGLGSQFCKQSMDVDIKKTAVEDILNYVFEGQRPNQLIYVYIG